MWPSDSSLLEPVFHCVLIRLYYLSKTLYNNSYTVLLYQILYSQVDSCTINRKITHLYSIEECTATDSCMIHACKYSVAVRRNYLKNYKDYESGLWMNF